MALLLARGISSLPLRLALSLLLRLGQSRTLVTAVLLVVRPAEVVFVVAPTRVIDAQAIIGDKGAESHGASHALADFFRVVVVHVDFR